jgi:hypothetical protein
MKYVTAYLYAYSVFNIGRFCIRIVTLVASVYFAYT